LNSSPAPEWKIAPVAREPPLDAAREFDHKAHAQTPCAIAMT
jgi:hypothetical protein